MSDNDAFDPVAVAFGSIAGVAQIVIELNRKGLLTPGEAEGMINRAVGMLPEKIQSDVREAYHDLLPSLNL